MFKWKLFLATLALSTAGFSLLLFLGRPKQPRPVLPELISLSNRVSLTSQLEARNVVALGRRRYVDLIVDIRPDGEAQDQAPSTAIEAAAKPYNIRFHYIPVPHEGIPESAVTALDQVLSENYRSAVLYCRTGRRAARLFALVEASRPDGPKAGDILKMVSDAGFSADDLKDDIDRRIQHRNDAPAAALEPQ
jgi:uncharacterized protein (TIGR01244 family)